MNIIYIVKCCMSKSSQLDPPMLWGDDDHWAIKMIRFSCSVLTIGFVGLMYALEIFPKLYYVLVKHNSSETDLFDNTYIYVFSN